MTFDRSLNASGGMNWDTLPRRSDRIWRLSPIRLRIGAVNSSSGNSEKKKLYAADAASGEDADSRASRSAEVWRTAIARVVEAAKDGSNLVPSIIAAVEAQATVGEIADAMRAVFGEYREAVTI